MAIITKELANKIVRKFNAEVDRDGAHPMAYVYWNGELVASFGLRHGSSKSQGYDHIPKQIHLGPGKAKQFAQCSMSLQDWVNKMIAEGKIAAPPKTPDTTGEQPSA
jgi:hypothetical protein